MATPYEDIFGVFIGKISDYNLGNLDQADLEEILIQFLRSAIVRFENCKQDLSDRNDALQQFTDDLTEQEIEILACYMIVQWLSPLINSIELLKQSLSSRDYRIYSQANHLKEMRELRDDSTIEAQRLKTAYSYSGDFSDLS